MAVDETSKTLNYATVINFSNAVNTWLSVASVFTGQLRVLLLHTKSYAPAASSANTGMLGIDRPAIVSNCAVITQCLNRLDVTAVTRPAN